MLLVLPVILWSIVLRFEKLGVKPGVVLFDIHILPKPERWLSYFSFKESG